MDDRKSIEEQNPHVVIGCPGRIFDLIRRGYLDVRSVKIFVVDEADEMLSKGFQEQIQSIFQWLPNDVQVGFAYRWPGCAQVVAHRNQGQ